MPSIKLSPDLEDLAASWLRYARKQGQADFESWERTRDLAEHDPELAWQIALALIDSVPDDLLDHVAANVLEHILEHHAEGFIDRVEAQCHADPRFRTCLSTVWLVDDDAPEPILARLRLASGGRLEVMPRAELERMERDYDAGGA